MVPTMKLFSIFLATITHLYFLMAAEVFAEVASQPNNKIGANEIGAERPEELIYWYRNYDSEPSLALLQLALDQTKDLFGEVVIKRGEEVTQGRAIIDLEHGNDSSLQIINVVVNPDREKKLIPIRIAADEGLIGLRVCVINKEDKALFENVRSHKDILDRGIVFGQGLHWPDTEILQTNGFQVETSATFENLFPMLEFRRFNCFLRGVSEARDDLKRLGENEFIIEPNLLFSYPSATLFFVNKSERLLAARIELGLRRAILNGSYQTHFKKRYDDDIKALKLSERRVIRLNNPLISDDILKRTSERPQFSDGKLEVY